MEVRGFDVPSGVRHTPLTREDTMSGARQRAEALIALARQNKEFWSYFVGLEGGLDVVSTGGQRHVFLQNWAYVTDGRGRGSFGQSGGIVLPDALAAKVVNQGSSCPKPSMPSPERRVSAMARGPGACSQEA
jgi:non-canonical (house-cleaning) NTP pyrophosphatase